MPGPSLWPTSAGAPPLSATPRDPANWSEGAQVEAVGRALGTPLLPWQRYVADVAGERRPDGSYEHQIVVVSVPRQSGKTALLRAMGTHRAMLGRSVFYTAQTGKDARARWTDLVKALRLAPAFASKVKSEDIKIALRGGSEHVRFPSGGVFQAFAPTVESLHGYTPPTVAVDEAFAQSAANGELLVGAIEPAQRTIVDRQLWIVSTMGTAESTFFHDWVDRAADGMPRVALFLWGAADHHDPFNLDDIAAFHPAVGFEFREVGHTDGLVTTPESILASAERMSRAEYERAYGNRRTLTKAGIIDADAWQALADTALVAPASTRDLVVTYDVDVHRRSAAILASWLTDAGQVATKVVRAEPGTRWLVEAVDALDRDWKPARVAAVGHGPVLDFTEQLRDRGVDVIELPEREFATASGAFLSLISDAGIVHDGGELLGKSVTGLVPRVGVVDGIAFSRRHSAGDSSAAIAAVVGAHTARDLADYAAPLVYFKETA